MYAGVMKSSKLIGLIGGTSWQSTSSYYIKINQGIGTALGGMHSGRILLTSVDFEPFVQWMNAGKWDELATALSNEAVRLENAGADCLLICTNTMHKVADRVQEAVKTPLLHIGDSLAEALSTNGVKKALLLGTTFTMREGFLKDRLREHGIQVVLPSEDRLDDFDRIIFDELCKGIVSERAKELSLNTILKAQSEGVDGVILGCTELAMLGLDSPVPCFDTTDIHAMAAVNFALQTPVPQLV